MSATDRSRFELPLTGIGSCSLDEAGAREQRDRYARLARSVSSIERRPQALEVTLDPSFDRDLLAAALAVERGCCPFFGFELDEAAGRLRVTVARDDQLPALDAIAHALAASV